MAKKTKKQKIIAEYHWKLKQTLQEANGTSNGQKDSNSNLNTVTNDYSYVKSGLLRTLILTVLAIAAQVVLRYVLK